MSGRSPALNYRRPAFYGMLATLVVVLSAFALRDRDRAASVGPANRFASLVPWPAEITTITAPSLSGATFPELPMAVSPIADAGRSLSAPGQTVVTHPMPPELASIRQLTFDGCCPGAWWAADSASIQFIDRPEGRLGIYAVPLWPPGSLPQMVDTALALRTGDTRFLVRPEQDQSMVKDVQTGAEWSLPTGGHPVRLSRDGSRAVWWEAPGGRAQVDALGRIYGSNIDGSDAQPIGGLWDADVVAFLPDNLNVLVSGRAERDSPVYLLATIDSRTGAMRELARGHWLSDVLLAPGGAWAAYLVSLDRGDPEANGVWVVPTEPGKAAPVKLPAFGAYRWRDDHRLVYVPMDPGARSHALWQLDMSTGEAIRLLDPDAVPIRIAGNDWSIAPDGRTLAFVSEDDRNIWAVELP